MTRSKAATVEEYLAELPPERRSVVEAVREVVRQNLPRGYREDMGWGMITYTIPLERYPDTYNGQPLAYAALAAQKNYCALYLIGAYGETKQKANLREAFARSGKKMDMGKACLRFQRLEDLPLPAIGRFIAAVPPEAFIAQYEANRSPAGPRKAAPSRKRPARARTPAAPRR